MSIYTPVDADTLQTILARYTLGALEGYEILPGGAVNTNYAVHTSTGDYVLTLFESLTLAQAEQFMELLCFLNRANMPGATPHKDSNHQRVCEVFRRPATIVGFLPGQHPACPTIAQCNAIGAYLGKLHCLTSIPPLPSEACDAHWRAQTAQLLMPLLTKKRQRLLEQALCFNQLDTSLPSGLVHADLFKDNALFEGNTLTGVIDFYFAFHGPFIYDLAILLNDWATTSTGKCHEKRCLAIMTAYEKIRPLTDKEKSLLGKYRILAALRFWLSRLEAQMLPSTGTQLPIRDPSLFEARVKHLLEHFA